ncbi:MAG: sensor histidine kinase [Lachnospiraceae bacterium]|nr:sensor histidine kinase [Lachnospiraceae bacterium]
MLPEISLNILDIAQNSISARATLIQITLETQTESSRLKVVIRDDGSGMSKETLDRVLDPFYTTRTTRKVGLGIPFFKQEAECTGGSFSIESEPGCGTVVTAEFCTDNIDCMPLGDINATIRSLVTMNPQIDFCYIRSVDDQSFVLDTREVKEILGDVPFDTPEVSQFLDQFLEENEAELSENK